MYWETSESGYPPCRSQQQQMVGRRSEKTLERVVEWSCVGDVGYGTGSVESFFLNAVLNVAFEHIFE